MQNSQASVGTSDPIQHLKLIASKTGDLPPLTATAIRALEMTKDPDISVRELQAVVSQDQALAAKTLRIVNSAMYGLSREVSTVSHAISLLGLETLRSIIMAASVQQVFQSGEMRTTDLGTKLMSDHSWGAAIGARILAQRARYANPEEAFLCGLMHDIGKPVLVKNLGDRYTPIIAQVYAGEASFHEEELRTFGFSHAHVGALLADKWKFPRQFSEAIGYHHNPLTAPNFSLLACVTNFADLMMIALEIGFERNKSLNLAEQPSFESLKMKPQTIEDLLVEVRTAIAERPSALSF